MGPEIVKPVVDFVAEQLPHFGDPLWLPVMAGLDAAAVFINNAAYGSDSRQGNAYDGRKLAPVIDEAYVNMNNGMPVGDKLAKAAPYRLSGIRWGLTGLALIGAGILSHPTTESTSYDNDAAVVVVMNASLPQVETTDMHNGRENRYETGVDALGLTHYGGRLAVVEYGETANLNVPLTKTYKPLIRGLRTPDVSPMGDNLDQALSLAVSELPVATSGANNSGKHVGTIDLYDSGVGETVARVDGQGTNFVADYEMIHKKGVNLKVIVPGRGSSTYTYNSTGNNASGTNPKVFAAVGNKNIVSVDTEAQTTDAFATTTHEAGIVTDHKPDSWVLIPGVLASIYGLILYRRRVVKHKT